VGELSGERTGSQRSLKRLARREVTAVALAGLVLLVATAGALAVTGDLSQPAGTAGCVSHTGEGPCTDGHALAQPVEVAVSPDGKSVYVATRGHSRAVVRLDRNTTTGAISQPAGTAGCVSHTGAGPCAQGHGLGTMTSVAVSPDGESVYVAVLGNSAVARLIRNTTTGAITQPAGTAGCISENGSGSCADGHGLSSPTDVTVSPDGKSVYVATSGSRAVVRLNRNTTTGAITQPAGTAGCVSETGAGPCADGHALGEPGAVAVSPDGKSVYVASAYPSRAVARLIRNTTTGAISQPTGATGCISQDGAEPCADGHALLGPSDVVVSPDGKSVYVSSDANNAVVRINRNTTTGAIAQPAGTAGCVSNTGAGPCAHGHALRIPSGVAVSPDGKSVYVTSVNSEAVARLDRNTTSGAIAQPAGVAGCISEDGFGPCADGHALARPYGLAVSPDGRSVYVATWLFIDSGAVVRLNRAP
jgi:DNA-binding beta-propeller fold protein YncE